MSTDHAIAWATTPNHRIDTDLEAIPTRIADHREPLDELESAPTRIAHVLAPDDAKTTHVDIGALDEVAPDVSGTYDAVPLDDEDESTETRLPDEYVATKFIDRGAIDGDEPPSHGYETPQCAPALPAEPATTTHRLPEPRGPRAGRAWILAASCVAVGVLCGTGIGLAAHSRDDAPPRLPTHERPTQTRAQAPDLAAPETRAASPEEEGTTEPRAAAPGPAVVVEPAPDPEAALEQAREAFADDDLEAVDDALQTARSRGADEVEIDRLEARVAVARGDGALALEEVRSFVEAHGTAADWVSLGRLLVQAEHDPDAAEAFDQALALEGRDADAHLGLAGIRARLAEFVEAREHLDAARRLVEADLLAEPALVARLHATEALVAFELGEHARAEREARRARALDDRSSEAALLLARLALVRGDDPEPHLRDAIRGRAPAPMALGMLARRIDADEACGLAARYLERAPEGFDAPAVQLVSRGCSRRG